MRNSKGVFFLLFFLFFLSGSLYADLSDFHENESTTVVPRTIDNKKTKKNLINKKSNTDVEKKHKDTPPIKNKTDTGEKKKTGESKKKSPVHFQGLSLTGLKSEGVVELHKQVVVTQDDFRLESEEAKIYLEPPSNDVKKVVATGHVKITKKDENTGNPVHANSDVADFDNLTQMITLKGNARILKEGDLLTGDLIYYNLKTGWIKVERVKGIVTP
jgi:lipopolysaccharide transport protein LptA